MKLGILAGTFDPVHAGHLAFARQALQHNKLDKVLLMPERRPRHKTQISNFYDRMAMLKLAVQSEPNIEIFSTDESNFSLGSTIELIRKANPFDELKILVGSDVAEKLNRWEGLAELDDNVSFVIVQRQGSEKPVAPKHANFNWLNFDSLPLTSSQIRSRQTPSGIEAVDRYIAEHHLYS